MSGILGLIGIGGPNLNQTPYVELPDIFPFPVIRGDFVDIDVEVIYERILTDVLERSEKIPETIEPLLWDNCVALESPDGLVTMLVKAMVKKEKLFLVYDRGTKLVYRAKTEEQGEIEKAAAVNKVWKEGSKTGAFISFEKRRIIDMVRLYSALEYATMAALYKSMNMAKSIQFKIAELRASIAKGDGSIATDQASKMAEGMKQGRDLLLDSKDIIETAKPDLTAANAALNMINQRRSLYLKLPASYFQGETTGGLSDSGQADAKAVDRGLRSYFYSIIKPVFQALFDINLKYVADDTAQLSMGLQALRDFDTTSNDFMSNEEKRSVIAQTFRLTGKFEVPPDQKAAPEPTVNPAGVEPEKVPVK